MQRNPLSALSIMRAARWPRARLKTYLLIVTLAATLPLVALISIRTLVDAKTQRDELTANLRMTSRVVATAIERELNASQDALTAMAQDEALQRGDVVAFERRLRSSGLLRPAWSSLVLIDTEAGLLLRFGGTVVQAGLAPTTGRAEIDALAASWSSRGADHVVVNVLDGDAARRATWIGVPVVTPDGHRYLLAARVGLGTWQAMLEGNAPAGGYVALFDRDHRVLARTLAPGRFVGSPLPASAVRGMGSASAGHQKTALLGGGETYVAWQLMQTVGWGVGAGIPAEGFDAEQKSTVLWTLGVTSVCLLLGVSLSLLIARRVSEPLQRLAADGRGSGAAGHVAVTEIAQLHRAFDLSEKARKEALFRLAEKADEFETLFHTCPTGLALAHDAQCRSVLSNAAMEEMMPGAGVEPRGDELQVFSAGQRLEAAQQPLAIAAREGRDVAPTELELRRPGRPPAFVLASAVALADGRGAALAAVTDLTARRLAERERDELMEREKQARQQAEAASQAKDELLSMLGHELRNPLNAIVTSVEVLRAAPPGGTVADSARAVLARQTRKLATMVDELLDVGQVMAQDAALSRQPVDLMDVIDAAVFAAQGRAQERDHALSVQSEAGAWVFADARRLGQVMAHLLDNALRYTPAGGRVAVTLRREADEAVVSVEDSGPGIEAELLPRLFEPFAQGQRGSDRAGGGLGLGLALVKRLVELHGGSVGVRSSPGGNAFEWRLKNYPAPPARAAAGRRRIGVVEDNPDTLASMCSMLELAGHSVDTAFDGPSGVEMVLAKLPDLALIDIGLPGFDGREVARRCRSAGYVGRLIAISGYGLPHDVDRSIAGGFDAHLVKPIDPDRLLPLLQS